MFQPLSQQTVFEARAKAKRDTLLLLVLLFLIYGWVFALMGSLAVLAFGLPALLVAWVWKAAWAGLLIGAVLGIFQYLVARSKGLDELAGLLNAQDIDPKDDVHAKLSGLVREVSVAAGLKDVRVLVLPTLGLNAFSLADGDGHMAVGVTEGLLGRLDRSEVAGVVAHEAAHLVQGDSRLLTIAGVLCDSFGTVAQTAQTSMAGQERQGGWGRDGRSGGILALPVAAIWLTAMFGKSVAYFLSMALSRSREYMADAQAVRMTKNPLALASALRKIGAKYRGGGDAPSSLQMVFILNPDDSNLDEEDGYWADLFSTHPPVSRRIKRILGWAKADEGILEKMIGEAQAEVAAARPTMPRYFAFLADAWCGPLTFSQWLSAGDVKPGTWVCPEGSETVVKAGDLPDLSQLFHEKIRSAVTRDKCPHCHVPLVAQLYEGAPLEVCPFCSGTLLTSAVLDRVLARREKGFAPEDVRKALDWRRSQREVSLKDAECGVQVRCPQCDRIMNKMFHRMVTRVVMDRCSNDGAVWLDGGELETIQMLVENSDKLYPEG